MNRNGDDGAHDDTMNDAINDGASAVHDADLVSQLVHEDPALLAALEALPAALEPLPVPEGAWDRLSAALSDLTPAGKGAATSPVDDTAVEPALRSTPRPRWGWAHPLTWLAAAVLAAFAVGLGTWGVVQANERARLADEQRVLSYWMANPDLRMVSLQEVGSSAAAEPSSQSGRLGVVCILPDGRALLLQPFPAGRGESFVVVGRGSGQDVDLAVGAGNVIRFDLEGAESVVVMVARADGERVPIAWADVN